MPIFFPPKKQAFEANASSSGGKRSVNDKELSFTATKSQTKSESETKQKENGVLPNFPNE